jgi:hypothetical protein
MCFVQQRAQRMSGLSRSEWKEAQKELNNMSQEERRAFERDVNSSLDIRDDDDLQMK